MEKIFIPKFTKETMKEIDSRIAWLKKTFTFLSGENIQEILYWNDPRSPYASVLIDKDGQFKCFPYPSEHPACLEELQKDYPECKMQQLNFLPVKLSEVITDQKLRNRTERQMAMNHHMVLMHRHFDGRMLLAVGHYYFCTPDTFCCDFFALDTIGTTEDLKREAEAAQLKMPNGYGNHREQWLTLLGRHTEKTGWNPVEPIKVFS